MTQHKVYRIFDEQFIYIGSTSVILSRRKGSHHEDFKNTNKNQNSSYTGGQLDGKI